MSLIPIELDLGLIEEAVRLAVAGHPAEGTFQGEREGYYAIAEGEERERAFEALFRDWFVRLALDVPLHQALGGQPLIAAQVARCVVSPARRESDQGAELYVGPAAPGMADRGRRRLHLRLLPATLLDLDTLLPLLRRELLHVADMLDPSFGYQPKLPPAPAGPTHDRLLLERYAALWGATVAGRLVRRGEAPPEERAGALHRFRQAFPMFGPDPEPVFARFFEGPRPSHGDLVRFALHPRQGGGAIHRFEAGDRCALCGFPTYAAEPVSRLAQGMIAAIREGFPEWTRADPVCPQCAELYRSRAAAAPLG